MTRAPTARDQLDVILSLVRRLLRSYLLIGVVGVLGSAAAVGVATVRPRTYKSETLILYREGIRSSDLIGGEFSFESSPKVDPYYDVSWLHRPDVHGGEVSAGIVSGLVAPTAPDEGRWETLWHYMQSGPGVFKGDLYFYTTADGDIRDKLGQIDIKRCPLFLLTGEYDYSCTVEAMLGVAERTGAPATVMQGLGHFPMSENPEKFIGYLLPVLEEIRAL